VSGTLLIGDSLWCTGARRRLTAEKDVEIQGFLLEPGGLNLGLRGVLEQSSFAVLRASFRTVP
jgi:hypothetical protein